MAFQKDQLWWVPDDKDVWTLATQSSAELPNGCINFVLQKDQSTTSHQASKCLRAINKMNAPDDLVFLHDVNQATILYCIRERFVERKIYTSIGTVLMSVNPFQNIAGLYGSNVIKKYCDPTAKNNTAHVYQIPSRAYANMCQTGCNQSILISGESGAGKTEATKQCLSLLTIVASTGQVPGSSAINEESSTARTASSSPATTASVSISDIANRIIAASPILEAFGNAMTIRNPNSSRFGKWMVLNFTNKNVIHSSNIVSYLLEKSRVTQRDSKERNYHIFYQILRGCNETQMDQWNLIPEARNYRYLQLEDSNREPINLNDTALFKETVESFEKMGFTPDEIAGIFRIVCSILLLGNVNFHALNDGEGSEIKNTELITKVANMLGVSSSVLSYSLCNRTIESGKARKSVITIQLNVQKATETRDSLARQLYDKVFFEIVSKINSKSSAEGTNGIEQGRSNSLVNTLEVSDRCIGLLDIFGFEIFIENSFEQMCINYCNEVLQNHFNYVVFTAEKNLYLQESIQCATIEFRDNIDVIREIESMFRALDEESRIPKGTSKTWYDKQKRCAAGSSNSSNSSGAGTPTLGANGSSGGGKLYHVSFPNRRMGTVFVVKHYAGEVDYSPVGMLEKNVETLNKDLVGTMTSSSDPFIQVAFTAAPPPIDPPGAGSAGSRKQSLMNSAVDSIVDPHMMTSNSSSSSGGRGGGNARASVIGGTSSSLSGKSISWRFSNQLISLVTMLKQTDSHFIRCVKSNDQCAPQRFDANLVHKQLLYSGVFEVVKIQQSGLPCRLLHKDFVNMYRCLVPSKLRYTIATSAELVKYLINIAKLDLKLAQMGNTMIFFKGHEQRLLEVNRDELYRNAATKIQTLLRRVANSNLYRALIVHYRDFQFHYDDLSVPPAKKAFDNIRLYANNWIQMMSKAHRSSSSSSSNNNSSNSISKSSASSHNSAAQVLEGKLQQLTVKLNRLSARAELVAEARIRMKIRTEEGILSLQDIVSRAIDLDLTSHAIVIECKNTVRHYYHAVEFSDLVNTPHQLQQLSLNNMEDGIANITLFADLLSGSKEVIAKATAYKLVVDQEVKQVLLPMRKAFRNAAIMYDKDTGNLKARRPEKVDYLSMLRALLVEVEKNISTSTTNGSDKTTSGSSFCCGDTKMLFEDCRSFLTLLDDYVPRCDAIGALAFIDALEVQAALSPSTTSSSSSNNNMFFSIANSQNVRNSMRASIRGSITSSSGSEGVSFTATTTHEEQFSQQLVEFRTWADMQLSTTKLREALAVGKVPMTAIITSSNNNSSNSNMNAGEEELSSSSGVQVEAIQNLLNQLTVLTEPSYGLKCAIRAGTWIIKLRLAYIASEWEKLEQLVFEADQDGVEHCAFDEYPDCIEELNNCQWQVIYHGLLADALFVLNEPAFSAISLATEQWIELVKDLPENLTLVQTIHEFFQTGEVGGSSNSSNSYRNSISSHGTNAGHSYFDTALSKLCPALEGMLQLRSLMYQKDIELSKVLHASYLTVHADVIDQHGLRGIISKELEVCEKLICKYDLEEDLDHAIKDETAELYIYAGLDDQPAYNSFYELSHCIDELHAVLGDLQELLYSSTNTASSSISGGMSNLTINNNNSVGNSNNGNGANNVPLNVGSIVVGSSKLQYHPSLQEKINLATVLVKGRTLLSLSEEAAGVVWEKSTNEFEESVAACLLPANKSIVPDYMIQEYEIIVGDLVRRTLLQGYNKILSTVAVQGEVDVSISVSKPLLSEQFHQFNHLSEVINERFDEYPNNIKSLSFFTSAVLKLRKQVFEDRWDNSIQEILDKIATMHHGGGLLVPGLQEEVNKVKQELSARNAILSLKTALENVQIAVPDRSGDTTKPMVDLQPLRDAARGIMKNQGQHSKQLAALAENVLNVLQALLQGSNNFINPVKIDEAAALYVNYHLDSTSVENVFKYIRVHNFMKNLCQAMSEYTTADEICHAINCIRNSLHSMPQRFIPWLKASYIYCELVGAFATQDWIRIVESTRKLEECLEVLSNVQITIEGEGFNEGMFLSLIREKTARGYSTALKIKETEQQQQEKENLQSLTPEEVSRATLREEDERNPYGIAALRRAGYEDAAILNVQFPPRMLWAMNFDPVLLRKKGLRAEKLLTAGYTVPALYFAGYSVSKLKAAGCTISALRAAGVSFDQLKVAGFDEREIVLQTTSNNNDGSSGSENTTNNPIDFLKTTEYDASKLVRMGLALKELVTAGFSVLELRAAGFSAKEIRDAGACNVEDFCAAGFDLEKLKSAFDIGELRDAGISFYELQSSGVGDKCLLEAGFGADLERQALMELFACTNGARWKIRLHWGTNKPLSQWYGVRVALDEEKQQRVVSLDLSDNHLVGTIPEKLWLLAYIKHLYLGMNFLTGPVPYLLSTRIRNNATVTDLNIQAATAAMAPYSMNSSNNNITNTSMNTSFNGSIGGDSSMNHHTSNLLNNSMSFPTTPLSSASATQHHLSLQSTPMTGHTQLHQQQLSGSSPAWSNSSSNNNKNNMSPYHQLQQHPLQYSMTDEELYNEYGDTDGIDNEDTFNIERAALMELYHSTNGPRWHNKLHWGNNHNQIYNSKQRRSLVQGWHGITVNKQGRVTKISLPSNNLNGSIPNSIYYLEHLRELDVRLNQLTGPLPDTLGNIKGLTHIHAQSNRLSGSIPVSIGQLHHLQLLDLRSNQLLVVDTELSRELGNLKQLKYFGLKSNRIRGDVHDVLQHLIPSCKIVI